tara:strand:- start:9703 stop:9981 length:279 start_codon:yes stop_codon:yes gene_type:complete
MNYVITPDPFRRNTWWLNENAGPPKRVARIQVSESDDEQIEIDLWSPDLEYAEWFGSLRFDAAPSPSISSCIICGRDKCEDDTLHFGYDEEE